MGATDVMRPSMLLDCQRDLRMRLDDHKFIEVVIGAIAQSAGYADGPVDNSEAQWLTAVPGSLRGAAEGAQVYDVVRPMVSLTTWAASSMDDTFAFDRSLPPAPWGLVRLCGGVPLAERQGSTITVDWVLWMPIHAGHQHGYALLGFNDAYLNPDDLTRELRAAPNLADISAHLGRWSFTFFASIYDGQRMGPPLVGAEGARHHRGQEVWALAPETGAEQPSTNVARLMTALWTLMREPVVSTREERADRATGKRMRRLKMRESITVITLRHLVERGDPRGEKIEWDHCWTVRGHYRWQACGPRWSERRLIYVGPHVKGNLEGPLIQTEKVHRMVR